jgi:hypothetical protein
MSRGEKRMSHANYLALMTGISFLISIAPGVAGCAHYDPIKGGPVPRKSDHVISTGQGSSHLKVLEQELATVRSDRVVVSTALLRTLVRNGRIQQDQCKNISGQLEALKNVDFEETPSKESTE